MLYNLERDTKKDPKGKTWLDVFPEHRDESRESSNREQTDEEMLASLRVWARATAHLKPS